MLKAVCKNLVLIAMPLGLAVGCCGPHVVTQGAVFGTLAPDQTLVATSAHVETGSRVYAYNEENAVGPGIAGAPASDVNVVPAGANPQTWAIAQEVQEKLVSDPTLAPMGSSLKTEVSPDGVVTLRGAVASEDEQTRVYDSISNLPGVKSVNNQLTIGEASSSGEFNMQEQNMQMQRDMQMHYAH